MKRHILAIIPVLALLAGCRSDDVPEATGAYVSFGMPNNLTLDWEAEKRATRDALPAIPQPVNGKPDNIGVWGFNDRTGEPVFSNRKMIYKYGAEAEANANLIGMWSTLQDNEYPYEDPQKWHPSVTGVPSRYKFFAYSPYISTEGHQESDDVLAYEENFANFEAFVWHRLPCYTITDYIVNQTVRTYKSHSPGEHNDVQQLLMDHLYSRLRFCFILGPRFGDVREIRIKSLTINDLPSTKMMLRSTFTPMTNDPAGGQNGDPILDNDGNNIFACTRTWEQEPGTAGGTINLALAQDPILRQHYTDPAYPVLDDAGHLRLNAANREHYGYLPLGSLFAYPYDPISSVTISVVYDVYDKEGLLLRKDETASNVINLNLIGYTETPPADTRMLVPGRYYDVRIEIEPRFLYVLSDNDVNPDGSLIVE